MILRGLIALLRPLARRKKKIEGQICGAIYRYDGKRDPGYWDEPSHFTPNKAHLLWQVKTHMVGKPIEAFPEDIEFIESVYSNPVRTLSFRAPSSKWSEKDKEYMRNEMKHWPRDEKGRFKSYIDATPEERNLWNNKGNGKWQK